MDKECSRRSLAIRRDAWQERAIKDLCTIFGTIDSVTLLKKKQFF